MTHGMPSPDCHAPHPVPRRKTRRAEGDAIAQKAPSSRAKPITRWSKALARAFRWKRMLESGEFVTLSELAEREGIAPSYMTRVLRLTLLAPEIVEAILDGTQGPEVTAVAGLGAFSVSLGTAKGCDIHQVEW